MKLELIDTFRIYGQEIALIRDDFTGVHYFLSDNFLQIRVDEDGEPVYDSTDDD